ncbi:MAG: metallophosphoesterase [Gemmatimonadaceae bacterium]|nr:metallophosphoesterase [Gemmatimonadaceae bacterium]
MMPSRHACRGAAAAILTVLTVACGSSDSPAASPPVAPAPVATQVVVTPATVTLNTGATSPLTAAVLTATGTPVSGAAVAWTSSAPQVATVSATGVVTGVSVGSATIAAAAGTLRGTSAITVRTTPPAGAFQTTVPAVDFNVVPARPTDSAISLSLFSASARTVTLTLLDGGRSESLALTAGEPRVLELTGLSADRTYRYRISATSPALTYEGQFRTARANGSTYRFVMQADSHLDENSDPAVYINTLRNMLADSADFLVDLGDTFMSDKYSDYRDAAGHYVAQRYYFGLSGVQLPLYLVQGNHDAENGWLSANASWAASQRLRWFPAVSPNAFYSSGGTAAIPRNYYAWRWGEALFIALDPYAFTTAKPSSTSSSWAWTLGKEQYDWLTRTLESSTARYTFVFLHHLVGGQGFEARGGAEASRFFEWGGANADGTTAFAERRAGWAMPIHDLLVKHKVSAVFHGHDHLYVNQSRDGIRYLEVPQPSFARENSTQSASDYGYLSGVLLGSSGHVRVTVSPTKATVAYVRSRLVAGNGAVADQFDILPSR